MYISYTYHTHWHIHIHLHFHMHIHMHMHMYIHIHIHVHLHLQYTYITCSCYYTFIHTHHSYPQAQWNHHLPSDSIPRSSIPVTASCWATASGWDRCLVPLGPPQRGINWVIFHSLHLRRTLWKVQDEEAEKQQTKGVVLFGEVRRSERGKKIYTH